MKLGVGRSNAVDHVREPAGQSLMHNGPANVGGSRQLACRKITNGIRRGLGRFELIDGVALLAERGFDLNEQAATDGLSRLVGYDSDDGGVPL